MKQARRNLAIAAWVFFWAALVGALGGEVALRVEQRWARARAAEFARANPFHGAHATALAADTRVWLERWKRYRPGAVVDSDFAGERLQLRINRQGFRGADFDVPKPAGRIRVACIGGSTTVQGWTDDTTYPALLAAALRERHPEWDLDVLNLGVSGTRSHHWLEQQGELLGFEPDLVIQYDGVNDVAWEHLRTLSKERPLRRVANGSLLFASLFPIPPAALDPLYERTFANFTQLDTALASRGIAHVVATFAIPDARRLDRGFRAVLDLDVEQQWGRRMRLHRFTDFAALMDRFDERLAAYAAAHGLSLVPLHRELADPALFVDTCHMTRAGIAQLAQALLPTVERILAERGGP